MKRRGVAIALGASMLTAFVPGHVAAQTTQGVRAAQRFAIPAGSLAAALQAWSKVTKLQIVYRMDDVGRKRTNGIQGDYAPLLALQGLLIDTGLKIVTTEDGAVALRPLAGDEVDTSATPDIRSAFSSTYSASALGTGRTDASVTVPWTRGSMV